MNIQMEYAREGVTEVRVAYEWCQETFSWVHPVNTFGMLAFLSFSIYFYKYFVLSTCVLLFTPLKSQFIAMFLGYCEVMKDDKTPGGLTSKRAAKNMAFLQNFIDFSLQSRKKAIAIFKSDDKTF